MNKMFTNEIQFNSIDWIELNLKKIVFQNNNKWACDFLFKWWRKKKQNHRTELNECENNDDGDDDDE